jgi:D-threonine aldolase
MRAADLVTPALVLDAGALEHNLETMAASLPGDRLRPHVKAHKCTALAARQAAAGHRGCTCATIREVEGMAAAGLGEDLLLANEVLDATRLGRLDARVTVAVDSPETVGAAAAGGVAEVLVDVNVGLPRDLVRVLPARCDPTVALHERVHVVDGDPVLETWPVDLRGW